MSEVPNETTGNIMTSEQGLTMLPGKTLVIGPSRSGKSYFSSALKAANLNIVDTDKDLDLIKWRNDITGELVTLPLEPDSVWLANNHFIIEPEELEQFLASQGDVILFAHCWNIMKVIDQFDRVAYMFTPSDELERRLKINRPDHIGGSSPAEISFYRQRHLERSEEARQQNITFIDTTLSPVEFYNQLSRVSPMPRI
jgi:hypothetical protein